MRVGDPATFAGVGPVAQRAGYIRPQGVFAAAWTERSSNVFVDMAIWRGRALRAPHFLRVEQRCNIGFARFSVI